MPISSAIRKADLKITRVYAVRVPHREPRQPLYPPLFTYGVTRNENSPVVGRFTRYCRNELLQARLRELVWCTTVTLRCGLPLFASHVKSP